jgi:hypothetical protein
MLTGAGVPLMLQDMLPAEHRRTGVLACFAVASAIALLWTDPVASTGSESSKGNEPQTPVPVEDYPIYDRVITTKYLTSHTRLVLITKVTVNRLQPEAPPVSRAYFQENPVFERALPAELITDFVLKNVQPSRVEDRFNFGVRYRLVSPDFREQDEVFAARPVQALPYDGGPTTLGRLLVSRVGHAHDLALVYVAEERRDGTGGGLLVLLRREADAWTILETEVLWQAQREAPSQ